MRDYRVNKKKNNDYILSLKQTKNAEGKDVLSVKFADGRTFTNIEDTPENLAKIMAQQEQQATEGIKNIGVFKKRQALSEIGTFLSAGVTTGTYSFLAERMLETSTNDAETLAAWIAGGAIFIANFIVGGYFIKKNSGIVGELEKVNFRNYTKETLGKYKDYPNATAGLSARKVKFLDDTESMDNPFNIIDIERFSLKDLRRIVRNIKTEESFGFDYPTTDSVPKTYKKNK